MDLKGVGVGAVADFLRHVWASPDACDTDARIVCADGRSARAHRLVLAAISDLFRKCLLDVTDDVVIVIPDVSVDVIKSFLAGAYTGRGEAQVSDELHFLGFLDYVTKSPEERFAKKSDDRGLSNLTCKVCGLTLEDSWLLCAHMAEAHPYNLLKDVKVEDEDLSSPTVQSKKLLWSHFDRVSAHKACCNQCGEQVALPYMRRHLKSKHPEVDNENQSDDDKDWLENEKPTARKKRKKNKVTPRKRQESGDEGLTKFFLSNDGVFSCNECLETVTEDDFATHLEQSHPALLEVYQAEKGEQKKRVKADDDSISSRTCPECGKVYSKRKGMLVHMDAVHSGRRPFVCDECGMTFARKESFKRHNHADIRPFLCSVCGKTFARRHIRDIHERAHHGDKRYPCGFCEKRFVTNQKRTIHERIHTGEKPFECAECGKKFVQKHQLQTHTRIHTGARPYRCERCSQMFRHLSTKAKHNCPGTFETPRKDHHCTGGGENPALLPKRVSLSSSF